LLLKSNESFFLSVDLTETRAVFSTDGGLLSFMLLLVDLGSNFTDFFSATSLGMLLLLESFFSTDYGFSLFLSST